MKQLIKNIAIGLGIGSTIAMTMVAIYDGILTRPTIISIFLMSAFIGLISCIFQVEKLSLLTKTIIQLIGSFVAFVITAIYNKWITSNIKEVIMMLSIFFVIYFVIWTVLYFINKHNFEEINKKLAR